MSGRSVGITGHRVVDDPCAVARRVREALTLTADADDGPTTVRLTIFSALAEGADRLAARVALERPGAALTAVLPFEPADYMTDFASAESRAEFLELLALAATVETMGPTTTREEGYERAGRRIVDASDALLAVWDGGPSRGRGGTAEIVEYARNAGVPVLWISVNRGAVTLSRL